MLTTNAFDFVTRNKPTLDTWQNRNYSQFVVCIHAPQHSGRPFGFFDGFVQSDKRCDILLGLFKRSHFCLKSCLRSSKKPSNLMRSSRPGSQLVVSFGYFQLMSIFFQFIVEFFNWIIWNRIEFIWDLSANSNSIEIRTMAHSFIFMHFIINCMPRRFVWFLIIKHLPVFVCVFVSIFFFLSHQAIDTTNSTQSCKTLHQLGE